MGSLVEYFMDEDDFQDKLHHVALNKIKQTAENIISNLYNLSDDVSKSSSVIYYV